MNASNNVEIMTDQTMSEIEQSTAVDTMGQFSVRPKVLRSDAVNSGDIPIMALKADGTVWVWTSIGMQIVTYDDGRPFTGAIDIGLGRGGSHRAIIRNDNTVWMWGSNANSTLGIGYNDINVSFPRQVLGVNGDGYLQNIVKIFAGGNNTIAIDSDGKVYGWGGDGNGAFGSLEGYVKTPRLLSGIDNVKDAIVWQGASLFLKNDGTLWAMGNADHTATGHAKGTKITEPHPVLDSRRNPLVNVREISDRMVLLNDGTIWVWGPWHRTRLVVPGSYTHLYVANKAEVVTSHVFTLGDPTVETSAFLVRDTDKFLVWGTTEYGTPEALSTVNGLQDAVQFSGGLACVYYKLDGTVWVVGQYAMMLSLRYKSGSSAVPLSMMESYGSKKTFKLFDPPIPAAPKSIAYTLVNVHADIFDEHGDPTTRSATYSLAENYPNVAFDSTSGEIILLKNHPDEIEVNAFYGELSTKMKLQFGEGFGRVRVVETACGTNHTIALVSDGSVWTWGDNSSGQLGNGTTSRSNSLVAVAGLQDIVSVAAGEGVSFALRQDGNVYAWGANDKGQLGDGSATMQTSPVLLSGIANVKQIASGNGHTLFLTADGSVYSTGDNTYWQLGIGTTEMQQVPTHVSSLNNIKQVQAGVNCSFALATDGSVYSWGRNPYGQLGNGGTAANTLPAKVRNIDNSGDLVDIVSISSSRQFVMALTSDGRVYTWGYNAQGQLGTGDTTNRLLPVEVANVAGIASIGAGQHHCLAVKTDGVILAWGQNQFGQCGDGTTDQRLAPVVASIDSVASVCCGAAYSHAIKSDGTLWAWGRNNQNQLGIFGVTQQEMPIEVAIQ